jgi:DHA1 family bicyclomycin/chloramphenicol resistance-like MFS transporter
MLDKNKKRQIILLMTILFFLGVSATDIYVPSLPQMVKDFHTVPSNVNLTISSFSMSIAFFVLFTGEISNRYGRRRVLIAGVTIFGIAAFLMSIINNLWLMILLRSIQAIGAAVILIVPRLILKDSMNEQEQIPLMF